jgi:hypothetical protein
VSERTATRRWADAGFRRRVGELRADMVTGALGRLANGMSEAAGVLRQLLTAQSEPVRLGACRALLELALKLRDHVEFEHRLRALEELANIKEAPT